jgi:hypothetical protein
MSLLARIQPQVRRGWNGNVRTSSWSSQATGANSATTACSYPSPTFLRPRSRPLRLSACTSAAMLSVLLLLSFCIMHMVLTFVEAGSCGFGNPGNGGAGNCPASMGSGSCCTISCNGGYYMYGGGNSVCCSVGSLSYNEGCTNCPAGNYCNVHMHHMQGQSWTASLELVCRIRE